MVLLAVVGDLHQRGGRVLHLRLRRDRAVRRLSPWTACPGHHLAQAIRLPPRSLLLSLALKMPLGLVSVALVHRPRPPHNGKVVSAPRRPQRHDPEGRARVRDRRGSMSVAACQLADQGPRLPAHFGQVCGWLPNSTNTSHDKINVRNGLYALWSQVHFIANVGGTGTPTDPGAKQWIGYFTDTSTPPTGASTPTRSPSRRAPSSTARWRDARHRHGPLAALAARLRILRLLLRASTPCGIHALARRARPTRAARPARPTAARGYCEVN